MSTKTTAVDRLHGRHRQRLGPEPGRRSPTTARPGRRGRTHRARPGPCRPRTAPGRSTSSGRTRPTTGGPSRPTRSCSTRSARRSPHRAAVRGRRPRSAGRISLRVPWSGSDATSGIARYELAQSTDDGPWTTVSTTLTSPSADRSLASQHTLPLPGARRSTRPATSGLGRPARPFRYLAFSEYNSAISYSGAVDDRVETRRPTGAAGPSSRAPPGRGASMTFTGRSVAWVARTGPDRGQGGRLCQRHKVATVDLVRARLPRPARRVGRAAGRRSAARTVTIRVAGTAGQPLIDLDALVTAN